MWALGSFLSPRIADARATRSRRPAYEMLAGGLVLLPIGLAPHAPIELDPSGWSTRSILGLVYLVVVGSVVGYTAYVWLLANAPLAHGLDLRVREPGRRDHARRALPRRDRDRARSSSAR